MVNILGIDIYESLSYQIKCLFVSRVNPMLVPEEHKTGSYYNLYTDSKHVVEVNKIKI